MTAGVDRGAPIEIVGARAGDVDRILAVQLAAYRIEAERYGDHTLPPLTERRADVLAALDAETVLVARWTATDRAGSAGDDVVGSVRARVVADTAHIGRLSVLPCLHGRRIGRRLLDAIERATAPVGRYRLFTGHRSERSLRMYERAGYRRVRTERQSGAVVLIHLEKVVTTGPPDGASSHRER